MGVFVKGDIVVIPFPFSDLSGAKRRPALVLADLPGEDIILCQITSKAAQDEASVSISNSDFDEGALPVNSTIRASKIFTAEKSLIIRKAGTLTSTKIDEVKKVLFDLLR